MRPTEHLHRKRNASSCAATILLAAILFSLACTTCASAQPTKHFRWLSPTSNADTWAKIQNAFQSELRPDAAKTGGGQDLPYKFLERVGIFDQSALVIVGHRTAKVPAEDDTDEHFSSAFSFDLKAGAITKIERTDRLWHWSFKKLAQLDPHGAPDVVFTYLSCWECEPSEVLSTLRYDAKHRKWTLREWQPDKMIWWTAPGGLVVDADLLEGADDTLSFACLYGVLDLRGGQKNNIASRCHEVAETSAGDKTFTDVTVVFTLDGERLKLEPVTSLPEIKAVTAKLCARQSANPLCRMPAVSTYSSQERTMLGMFPTARDTRRDGRCFGALRGTFSVYTVVDKCCRPDAGGGSAIGFFEYGLYDGSTVTIHWADMQHVLDIVQSDKSGKTKTLLASK